MAFESRPDWSNILSFESHRDRDGEISRKHGDSMISTLRAVYGPAFAPDCQPTAMLSDVIHELDEPSLEQLVEDYKAGCLNDKLAAQA